jgi:hypothetical protein
MRNYIDITESIVFSGMVGSLAPFIFPYLFKLLAQIIKREPSKQEKRWLVAVVALLIAIGVAAYSFDWDGSFIDGGWQFIVQLATSWSVFQGAVKSIYELIIKNFPELDKLLERAEK